MFGGRFKELMKKYGKVAIGVHLSVSAASIAGLYAAVNSNVDVESVLERFGMPSLSKKEEENSGDPTVEKKGKNRTAELAATSGGALAVAVLLNKALFPIRVPITAVLTPPIARFLARRKLIKNSV